MTDKRHRALLSFPPSIPTLTKNMEPKADMCDAATINVIMEEIKCTRTKDNENKEEPKIKEKEDIKIPREKRKNRWCLVIISVTLQREKRKNRWCLVIPGENHRPAASH
jgi:hypothetical protein